MFTTKNIICLQYTDITKYIIVVELFHRSRGDIGITGHRLAQNTVRHPHPSCTVVMVHNSAWRAVVPPSSLLSVPNVTTHPSTASVPTSYHSTWHQDIFQDLEHGGCQPTLGGPFSSLLLSFSLSPPSPSPLSLISPWSRGGGCCAKVGGINPPEGGVGNPLRGTVIASAL